MNCNQNSRICQVSEDTVVIGVDIASETQYARAFDWRGIELSKVFRFENDEEGFGQFEKWMRDIGREHGKGRLLVGAEPTGHYWFTLAQYLKEAGIRLVLVNPYHVKQSKELDDNHPSKTDRKDPKTIARLVIEGRYVEPYIPQGIYAELRLLMECRHRILETLTAVKNRLQRWLKIYFPEYGQAFGKITCESSLLVLKNAPLPEDIRRLGAQGVNQIWRAAKLRAVGMKRAQRLARAAAHTVGRTDGQTTARLEMFLLMEDYDLKLRQYEAVMAALETLCVGLPEVAHMMTVPGVGLVTAAAFMAETGDLGRFESPRQIQKLAGLAIREISSGKHKGQSGISRRGRKRLRTALFRAALGLARVNPEFAALHRYYTTRPGNPLKKKQSIVALSCKLIRVLFALATKDRDYDPARLMNDIRRQQVQAAA